VTPLVSPTGSFDYDQALAAEAGPPPDSQPSYDELKKKSSATLARQQALHEHRAKGAQKRAMALMGATQGRSFDYDEALKSEGSGSPPPASTPSPDGSTKKSSTLARQQALHSHRAKGAQKRAMQLMQETQGRSFDYEEALKSEGSGSPRPDSKPSPDGAAKKSSGLARQQALYEHRQKGAAQRAIQLMEVTQAGGTHADSLERLATTSRKKPEKTPEDVRDPETISGMKCQMDWEREKIAEKKATKLLKSQYYIREEPDGFQVIV